MTADDDDQLVPPHDAKVRHEDRARRTGRQPVTLAAARAEFDADVTYLDTFAQVGTKSLHRHALGLANLFPVCPDSIARLRLGGSERVIQALAVHLSQLQSSGGPAPCILIHHRA